jgi:hypothetical protein
VPTPGGFGALFVQLTLLVRVVPAKRKVDSWNVCRKLGRVRGVAVQVPDVDRAKVVPLWRHADAADAHGSAGIDAHLLRNQELGKGQERVVDLVPGNAKLKRPALRVLRVLPNRVHALAHEEPHVLVQERGDGVEQGPELPDRFNRHHALVARDGPVWVFGVGLVHPKNPLSLQLVVDDLAFVVLDA